MDRLPLALQPVKQTPRRARERAHGKPSGALQVTSRGVPVKVLQNLLVINGVRCAADGIFGQATAGAVQQFQGLIGVPANGVADNPIQKWLAKGVPGLRALGKGDRGDDVAAFQRILNLHQCPVGIDGVFGEGMLGGVQAFQRKYGLSVSGVVDEGTRRASWR